MVEKSSRVAAIYDIHANLPALEAVLADLESVDTDLIVVGGDVVAVRCLPRYLSAWRRSMSGSASSGATPIVRLSQLTMRALR